MTFIGVVSVFSAVVTVCGFAVTIWQVFSAKSAAQSAEKAAIEAKDELRQFDAVMDFSALLAVLEETRRLQREKLWGALPERYSQARRLLIQARHVVTELTDDQKQRIQEMILNFRDMEILIESAESDDIPQERMLESLLENIDELISIFQFLKFKKVE